MDKEALLNGAAKIVSEAEMNNPALGPINALGQEVASGVVSSYLIIKVTPQGRIEWPAWGMQASELYMGCSMFQRAVEQMMAGKKNIIRPA